MAELEVTPESLAAAADGIVAALGGGEVARPPTPSAAAFGHPGLGVAAVEFGTALSAAAALLVATAERAAAALREGAQEYTAREQANLAALMGVRPTGGS